MGISNERDSEVDCKDAMTASEKPDVDMADGDVNGSKSDDQPNINERMEDVVEHKPVHSHPQLCSPDSVFLYSINS